MNSLRSLCNPLGTRHLQNVILHGVLVNSRRVSVTSKLKTRAEQYTTSVPKNKELKAHDQAFELRFADFVLEVLQATLQALDPGNGHRQHSSRVRSYGT